MLTVSARRLGIAIIDSAVVVDVQLLCVGPEGLPHGHIDVVAVHAPPHQLLLSRAQSSTHVIHHEAFVDPRVTSLIWQTVALSTASAKSVLQ